MPICPNCGVELSETARMCPLCRELLPESGEGGPGPGTAGPNGTAGSGAVFETLPPSYQRKIFLEVFSVCSLIGCLVVLAVEVIISRRVWWSLYPITSIAYIDSLVCIPVVLKKIPALVGLILSLATLVFIFLIALVSNGLFWFWPVAMPIVLIVEVSVFVCVLLSVTSKRKGINVIAIVLLGISAICIGIETVLNLYIGRHFLITWSAVVATAAVAIAVFLFYMHYRFNNRSSLKKLFHI